MANTIAIIALSLIMITIIVSWIKDHRKQRWMFNTLNSTFHEVSLELGAIRRGQRKSSKKYYDKKKQESIESAEESQPISDLDRHTT